MLSLVDRLSNDGQARSVTRTQLDRDRDQDRRRPPASGDVQIRAAAAADCEGIRSFVAALSLRARFLRFFTAASEPSSAVLRRMCGAAPTSDVLVATEDGAIVGHAMAVDLVAPDGSATTDLGLVVADRWQNRGVGSEMFRRLTERAAARGVRAAVMDVLPENRQMLSIIDRYWGHAGYEFSAGSVIVRVPLADQLPDQAPQAAEAAVTHPSGPPDALAAFGPVRPSTGRRSRRRTWRAPPGA
jgi:predicted N-acetyltransferase YhbS